jgi:hypothetical protein
MNSDQSKPLIDLSEAKEPAHSLEQQKDTMPPESESLEQKQISDDLNDPVTNEETIGERQTILANIPGGAAYSVKEDRY